MLNVTEADVSKLKIFQDCDTIFYDITLVRKPMFCPICGSKMIRHGHKKKTINHPALRDHNGVILYNANRYRCKVCNKTLLERNPFTFPGFNSSFLLIRQTMKMLKNLNYNLKMISEELNISTTQICKYLDSYVVIPPRTLPESLGIDEIHNKYLSRKNSSYLYILVDNTNRHIYDILDSRNKAHLASYFSKYTREQRLKVKYVTIDMWEPYKSVVNIYLPNAIIAVDPFHVIWHLTNAFDRLRLDIMKQCEYGSPSYYLLKSWNWLLSTDSVDLDNERVYNRYFHKKLNRRDILDMILQSFPILAQAYELKEEYRYINKYCSYEEAYERFDVIYQKFKNCGIPQFYEFTSLLFHWREEILNSFLRPYDDRKLTNALSENVNKQIRRYLSVSNGVSNYTRFRKRVLYALSPDMYYSITHKLRSNQQHKRHKKKYKNLNN